jgi:hypothetical protein
VLTLTDDEIEAALRTATLRAAGLHDASFPALTIAFQRTLRIPADGRTYPLPAGLGAFPLRSLDDFPATLHWPNAVPPLIGTRDPFLAAGSARL